MTTLNYKGIITDYHHGLFQPTMRHKLLEYVLEQLDDCEEDVGIVCTGISGMMMAVLANHITTRPLMILRKRMEITNSNLILEGIKASKWVIIDDFIDTGETIDRILSIVPGRCVRIILYKSQQQDSFRSKDGKRIPINCREHKNN